MGLNNNFLRSSRSTAISRLMAACALAIGINFPVAAEWVDTIADAKIELFQDDNVNRSAFPIDENKDDITSASVSFGKYFQLNQEGANYTRLRLTADLEHRTHSEFDELDRTNVGVNATLTHKFGLGPYKPWAKLFVSALTESVDNDDRDKEIYSFGTTLGKQYTDRFGASISASFIVQDGQDDLKPVDLAFGGGNVFDLNQFVLSGSANYRLAEKWLVSSSVSYLDGELNGQCTGASLAFVKANITITALTPDTIFGGCRYRIDATGLSYGLTSTYAINSHASINFGLSYSEGGRQGLEYQSQQYFANFRYSL